MTVLLFLAWVAYGRDACVAKVGHQRLVQECIGGAAACMAADQPQPRCTASIHVWSFGVGTTGFWPPQHVDCCGAGGCMSGGEAWWWHSFQARFGADHFMYDCLPLDIRSSCLAWVAWCQGPSAATVAVLQLAVCAEGGVGVRIGCRRCVALCVCLI